jgi:hypothetical protein
MATQMRGPRKQRTRQHAIADLSVHQTGLLALSPELLRRRRCSTAETRGEDRARADATACEPKGSHPLAQPQVISRPANQIDRFACVQVMVKDRECPRWRNKISAMNLNLLKLGGRRHGKGQGILGTVISQSLMLP